MSYPNLLALLEAIVYVAKEPVGVNAILKALPFATREEVEENCRRLIEKYRDSEHGIEVREVAEGLRFSTKPEHHEALKHFIQNQTPPTRLSLAALETLAVIAYKQPVTIPEIQEIRGVQATGVIKTLLDKKLVSTAGRKEVLGRPMLYTTTREFLVHFGLKSVDELPSMEEFEELIKSQAASGEESVQAELPLEDLEPAETAGIDDPQPAEPLNIEDPQPAEALNVEDAEVGEPAEIEALESASETVEVEVGEEETPPVS